MIAHRWRNFCLVLVLFSFVLTACAPTNVIVYKEPERNSAKYDVVQISTLDKTDAEWVPYDSGTMIADMVAEKLRKTNHFSVIGRSESNADLEGRVLLVKGTVTGYTRGCKYCERLIRVNDKGKGSVSVRVKLIDKATGETLADAVIEGRAKEPGYGRSRYIRVANEIVKLIESVNGEQS